MTSWDLMRLSRGMFLDFNFDEVGIGTAEELSESPRMHKYWQFVRRGQLGDLGFSIGTFFWFGVVSFAFVGLGWVSWLVGRSLAFCRVPGAASPA